MMLLQRPHQTADYTYAYYTDEWQLYISAEPDINSITTGPLGINKRVNNKLYKSNDDKT